MASATAEHEDKPCTCGGILGWYPTVGYLHRRVAGATGASSTAPATRPRPLTAPPSRHNPASLVHEGRGRGRPRR